MKNVKILHIAKKIKIVPKNVCFVKKLPVHCVRCTVKNVKNVVAVLIVFKN